MSFVRRRIPARPSTTRSGTERVVLGLAGMRRRTKDILLRGLAEVAAAHLLEMERRQDLAVQLQSLRWFLHGLAASARTPSDATDLSALRRMPRRGEA